MSSLSALRTRLLGSASLAVAPVALWQGRAVRRRVPMLPEAPEPKQGAIAGAGSPVRLVALGDSVVAGVGAPSHEIGLTGRTAAGVAQRTGRPVEWTALGRNGYTASLVRRRLVARVPQGVDAVLLTVGLNAVTSGAGPGRWQRDLGDLLDALEERMGRVPTVVSGMPPVHLFPALPNPLRWMLVQRARAFELRTREVTSGRQHTSFSPIRPAALAGDFAADGFHPGPATYALLGEQFGEELAGVLPRRVTPRQAGPRSS